MQIKIIDRLLENNIILSFSWCVSNHIFSSRRVI